MNKLPSSVLGETEITISTPNKNGAYKSIGFGVQNIDSIKFSVKACNDAHIGLQAVENEHDHDLYEIVLAGWANTQSVIRTFQQQKPAEVTEATPKLLDCKKMKPFWISWINGDIVVGEGHEIGQKPFMKYAPTPTTKYEINFMSIYTGYGSKGDWSFIKQSGKYIPLYRVLECYYPC